MELRLLNCFQQRGQYWSVITALNPQPKLANDGTEDGDRTVIAYSMTRIYRLKFKFTRVDRKGLTWSSSEDRCIGLEVDRCDNCRDVTAQDVLKMLVIEEIDPHEYCR